MLGGAALVLAGCQRQPDVVIDATREPALVNSSLTVFVCAASSPAAACASRASYSLLEVGGASHRRMAIDDTDGTSPLRLQLGPAVQGLGCKQLDVTLVPGSIVTVAANLTGTSLTATCDLAAARCTRLADCPLPP